MLLYWMFFSMEMTFVGSLGVATQPSLDGLKWGQVERPMTHSFHWALAIFDGHHFDEPMPLYWKIFSMETTCVGSLGVATRQSLDGLKWGQVKRPMMHSFHWPLAIF